MVQNLTSTWSFRRHDAGKTVVADLAVGAMDLRA
jgi:hypothetical protein